MDSAIRLLNKLIIGIVLMVGINLIMSHFFEINQNHIYPIIGVLSCFIVFIWWIRELILG